LNHKFTG